MSTDMFKIQYIEEDGKRGYTFFGTPISSEEMELGEDFQAVVFMFRMKYPERIIDSVVRYSFEEYEKYQQMKKIMEEVNKKMKGKNNK